MRCALGFESRNANFVATCGIIIESRGPAVVGQNCGRTLHLTLTPIARLVPLPAVAPSRLDPKKTQHRR
jgi:hypothetical protein